MRKLFSLVGAFWLTRWIYRQNYSLEIETIELPIVLDKSLKIVQLSDCHFPYLLIRQSKLLKQIKKLEPDLIVISGDLIDRQATQESCLSAVEFVKQLNQIAPVLFSAGNHDQENKHYLWLLDQLSSVWINVDKQVYQQDDLRIVGSLNHDCHDPVTVCLCHHPEKAAAWQHQAQVIASGHGHGGQVRVAGKGLFCPGQGFWPRYSRGVYRMNQTYLIVSGGLGASQIPLRVNNYPHLVVMKFKGRKSK